MDVSRHAGRTAIVTGAASGIGRATVLRMAGEGGPGDRMRRGRIGARAVLPVMQETGRGSIVTVASEASVGAGASGVAYTSSKHGVIGLVRHVAFFYGPSGIRSNAVLPGPVETGIGATSAPQSEWTMGRAQLKMATMPKPAQPDEVAR